MNSSNSDGDQKPRAKKFKPSQEHPQNLDGSVSSDISEKSDEDNSIFSKIPGYSKDNEHWVNFETWFSHVNSFSKHNWDYVLQKGDEAITKCYWKKQGKEKIILEAFEKFGGIVLFDYSLPLPKIVAAAVVEMNHRRVFDNSNDDH